MVDVVERGKQKGGKYMHSDLFSLFLQLSRQSVVFIVKIS
jgi:hypothetical protein